jgi:hypothetical protein
MGLISGKINTFDRDTLLFEDGDDINFIAFIKEGNVIKEGAIEESFSSGDFICIKDLYNGFYSADYTAMAGTSILPISASSPEELVEFFQVNRHLQSELSYELCVLITNIYDIYQSMYNDIEDFYSSIIVMHERYLSCCKAAGVVASKYLLPHPASDYKFETQDFYKNFSIFRELAGSKPKAHTFIKANGEIALKTQIDVIKQMYVAYDDMVYYLKTIISLFASKSDSCLFALTASLADNVSSKYKSAILQLLTDMKNVILHIDEDLRNNSGYTIDIDYNRVNFYFMIVENMHEDDELTDTSPSDGTANTSTDTTEATPTASSTGLTNNQLDLSVVDVSNSLHKLCSFAGFNNDIYFKYDAAIKKFMELPDKTSSNDDVRRFRKEFLELFIKLYEEVFLHYAKLTNRNEHDDIKIIQMFLDFGYLDERLLTDAQIEVLLNIPELNQTGPCNIYRMKDWLLRIYRGEEIPSKNEFDMDYNDSVRERKKTEAITSQKEMELLNNVELKTRFEIQNLVKYNLRLLNGNMLSFFPMLHMDSFERDIKNMILTGEDINASVIKLVDIDYSIFYRELLYSDPANKIPKATIQKEIYPNIILFPTTGVNGIMWQDTSGKKMDSAGRFLLPSLFAGSIEDIMLSLFGRFRFELCKTTYSTAWNNIQIPSLTSEFCDYVQFYRKNKELSSEKKEALKNQIARCRNNMREIFMYDYIIYMRYESAGAIRLNKISRRILATYCPYSKPIREKIMNQPIFAEAMSKFQRDKLKKTKEVSNMIIALQRGGATLTKELNDTKKFYEEL